MNAGIEKSSLLSGQALVERLNSFNPLLAQRMGFVDQKRERVPGEKCENCKLFRYHKSGIGCVCVKELRPGVTTFVQANSWCTAHKGKVEGDGDFELYHED